MTLKHLFGISKFVGDLKDIWDNRVMCWTYFSETSQKCVRCFEKHVWEICAWRLENIFCTFRMFARQVSADFTEVVHSISEAFFQSKILSTRLYHYFSRFENAAQEIFKMSSKIFGKLYQDNREHVSGYLKNTIKDIPYSVLLFPEFFYHNFLPNACFGKISRDSIPRVFRSLLLR